MGGVVHKAKVSATTPHLTQCTRCNTPFLYSPESSVAASCPNCASFMSATLVERQNTKVVQQQQQERQERRQMMVKAKSSSSLNVTASVQSCGNFRDMCLGCRYFLGDLSASESEVYNSVTILDELEKIQTQKPKENICTMCHFPLTSIDVQTAVSRQTSIAMRGQWKCDLVPSTLALSVVRFTLHIKEDPSADGLIVGDAVLHVPESLSVPVGKITTATTTENRHEFKLSVKGKHAGRMLQLQITLLDSRVIILNGFISSAGDRFICKSTTHILYGHRVPDLSNREILTKSSTIERLLTVAFPSGKKFPAKKREDLLTMLKSHSIHTIGDITAYPYAKWRELAIPLWLSSALKHAATDYTQREPNQHSNNDTNRPTISHLFGCTGCSRQLLHSQVFIAHVNTEKGKTFQWRHLRRAFFCSVCYSILHPSSSSSCSASSSASTSSLSVPSSRASSSAVLDTSLLCILSRVFPAKIPAMQFHLVTNYIDWVYECVCIIGWWCMEQLQQSTMKQVEIQHKFSKVSYAKNARVNLSLYLNQLSCINPTLVSTDLQHLILESCAELASSSSISIHALRVMIQTKLTSLLTSRLLGDLTSLVGMSVADAMLFSRQTQFYGSHSLSSQPSLSSNQNAPFSDKPIEMVKNGPHSNTTKQEEEQEEESSHSVLQIIDDLTWDLHEGDFDLDGDAVDTERSLVHSHTNQKAEIKQRRTSLPTATALPVSSSTDIVDWDQFTTDMKHDSIKRTRIDSFSLSPQLSPILHSDRRLLKPTVTPVESMDNMMNEINSALQMSPETFVRHLRTRQPAKTVPSSFLESFAPKKF